MFMWGLRRRARADYRAARGFLHRKLIEDCLPVLKGAIGEHEKAVYGLEVEFTGSDNERKAKLHSVLVKHLVNTEFPSLPGIGPVLTDRVLRTCFDGRVESLRNVYGVPGIGDQRMRVIRSWVTQAERRVPALLGAPFPGKEEITRAYDRRKREKHLELNGAQDSLRVMRDLRASAESELRRLKAVKPSVFVRAYKGNREAAEVATRYLVGSFPEWGRMPEWFKTLIERYGGASSPS